MLIIQNIDKIRGLEFSNEGKDWYVFGMEEQKFHYSIAFIPRDMQHRVWDIAKTQMVYLSREKVSNLKDTYRLSSGKGVGLIKNNELNDLWNIVKKVCNKDLIV